MTEAQTDNLKAKILLDAHQKMQRESALRLELSLIGQHLMSLGRALEEHPEEVTSLPEPQSIYDYRSGLNILGDRQKVIKLCDELRYAKQESEFAERRKAMLDQSIA